MRKICTLQRGTIPPKLTLHRWPRMIMKKNSKEVLGEQWSKVTENDEWGSSIHIIELRPNWGISLTSKAGCFHKTRLQRFQNYYTSAIAISYSSPFLTVAFTKALLFLSYLCVLSKSVRKGQGEGQTKSESKGNWTGLWSKRNHIGTKGAITEHMDHKAYESSYWHLYTSKTVT